MDNAIALVGGGATALAFVYHYLRASDSVAQLPRTIYVFEKRRQLGAGTAYEADAASNILNTKTAYITPFPDRPGDFFAWLHANDASWRADYPAFNADPDSYAPRPLFGAYLQERMEWLVGLAASRGLRIVRIHQEVKGLRRIPGQAFELDISAEQAVCVRHVVLACGTFAERGPARAHADRTFATPYPITRLQQRVPKDAMVAVIGARLSAIDAVVGLMEHGHRGAIAIYSRSGHFPSVRGTQGRITPRYLTAEGIEALQATKGALTIRDLVALVRMEIAHQSGVDLQSVPGLAEAPAPPACLQSFLHQEIDAARFPRAWQAVLYSTNAIIERLWNSLGHDEKQEFLQKYMSAFMAHRVSIPAENAEKVLRYLESRQLEFCAGPIVIDFDPAGMPQVCHRGRRRTYDYVINAKGSPRGVECIESPLIEGMLEHGYLVPDELGGVRIDPASYLALDASGIPSGSLRVIGELTTGAFFFTSALDINARHAKRCVEALAMQAQDDAVAGSSEGSQAARPIDTTGS
jgi:uncharacterized NAD(P)/FAD-binding protein YdhS